MITARLVEIEKTVIEEVGRQKNDVQGKKHIPEQEEQPGPPSADAQIGNDKTA